MIVTLVNKVGPCSSSRILESVAIFFKIFYDIYIYINIQYMSVNPLYSYRRYSSTLKEYLCLRD